MGHGEKSFDSNYYKRFFNKYTNDEFKLYCRWAEGWVNFLSKYVSFDNSANKSLLEIGSSLGYFSRIFKDRGFDVWASDISSYIVKKATKINKDINFFVYDVEKGRKINKKFDYVVAFEVLEHLKNPSKALQNIHKLMPSGGTFIFSTPFPTKRSLADPTHINVHDASWWIKLGEKTGYSSCKIVYASFIPFLYRFSKLFSKGFAVKTNIPYINSTAFLIFKK